MNPALLRNQFPALRAMTYLNSAGAGPVPLKVAQSAMWAYESMVQHGDVEWDAMMGRLEESRGNLAQLVGCKSKELAFTRNTSHSSSLVAQSLWDAGYRKVVALREEFPASTLPFLHRGFELKFVEAVDGQYPPEAVEAALEAGDVLVASHVIYQTGAVNDPRVLGEVARRKGARFVLCVTQSLGALQVNFAESGADFMTGTSYKWLCAGFGGGFLAIREDVLKELPFAAAGWISVNEPFALQNDRLDLLDEARVLDLGCPTFPTAFAVGEACQMWLAEGPAEVEARVRQLSAHLREKLVEAGFSVAILPLEQLSGITVIPDTNAERHSAMLLQRRVVTSARGKGLRIAVHAFNDENDIATAMAALQEVWSGDDGKVNQLPR